MRLAELTLGASLVGLEPASVAAVVAVVPSAEGALISSSHGSLPPQPPAWQSLHPAA
jgi:hypothetical protein